MKRSEKFWILFWLGCNLNLAYLIHYKYQIYLAYTGHNDWCSFFISGFSCTGRDTHSSLLLLTGAILLTISVILGVLGYGDKYWEDFNKLLNKEPEEG